MEVEQSDTCVIITSQHGEYKHGLIHLLLAGQRNACNRDDDDRTSYYVYARHQLKSVATARPTAAVSGTRDAYTSFLPAAPRPRGSAITQTAAPSSAIPA